MFLTRHDTTRLSPDCLVSSRCLLWWVDCSQQTRPDIMRRRLPTCTCPCRGFRTSGLPGLPGWPVPGSQARSLQGCKWPDGQAPPRRTRLDPACLAACCRCTHRLGLPLSARALTANHTLNSRPAVKASSTIHSSNRQATCCVCLGLSSTHAWPPASLRLALSPLGAPDMDTEMDTTQDLLDCPALCSLLLFVKLWTSY